MLTHVIKVTETRKKNPLIGKLRNGSYQLHMSHDKGGVTEQQFNVHWNQIFKLLPDLGYDISMLTVVKSDDNFSRVHIKRF